MFKNLVILKKSPWFLYADNEKDALQVCNKFKDDVVGVVSGKDLIVKHPRFAMTLEQTETLQIEAPKKDNKEVVEPTELEPQIVLDMEASIKELDDEFDKLTEAVDNA